jgi:hypothetical protein
MNNPLSSNHQSTSTGDDQGQTRKRALLRRSGIKGRGLALRSLRATTVGLYQL